MGAVKRDAAQQRAAEFNADLKKLIGDAGAEADDATHVERRMLWLQIAWKLVTVSHLVQRDMHPEDRE